MASPREKVIFQARFDPKWRTYIFLNVVILMTVTVFGLVLLPFWILGWGAWYSRRYFAGLECLLCERSLVVGRGIFFRTEKTIPLDKIQDLTLQEGPLLKMFGLCSLKIETAGQGGPQGSSEASLVGIIDARGFRDRVLDQRDVLSDRSPAPAADREATESNQVLAEIRDVLVRIESRLGASRGS